MDHPHHGTREKALGGCRLRVCRCGKAELSLGSAVLRLSPQALRDLSTLLLGEALEGGVAFSPEGGPLPTGEAPPAQPGLN